MDAEDGNLSFYAEKAEAHELELATIAAELELSRAVATIHRYPEWSKFAERLEVLRANIFGKLMRVSMTPYELGKRQGLIAALDAVLSTSMLTGQEVDEKRKRITTLTSDLEELRHLLN